MEIPGPISIITQHGKEKNLSLAKALLNTEPGKLLVEPLRLPLDGTIGMVGCWPTIVHHLRNMVRSGRPWFYVDNGYFAPYKTGGYFRVSMNAMQHDGTGPGNKALYEKIGKPIVPWRKSGRHVLVCFQSPRWMDMFHGGIEAATSRLRQKLREHTDRPIVFRHKGTDKPLERDLVDCHALVCFSSNAAVEAVLFGVPVFCLNDCAASRMGLNDLALIESPVYPDDREPWAHALAANQWTLSDMHSGKTWSDLRERPDPARRQLVLG